MQGCIQFLGMTGNIHLNPKVKGRHCSSLGSFIKVVYLKNLEASLPTPDNSIFCRIIPNLKNPQAVQKRVTPQGPSARRNLLAKGSWAGLSDPMVLLKQQPMTSWQTPVALIFECGGLSVPWWHRNSSGSCDWRFSACPSGSSRKWWHLRMDFNFECKIMGTFVKTGYPNAPEYLGNINLFWSAHGKNISSWSWLFCLNELSLLWLVQELQKEEHVFWKRIKQKGTARRTWMNLTTISSGTLNTWKFRKVGPQKSGSTAIRYQMCQV